MKHNLFRNPGLKIASLAIAFVVWLIILNVSNPVTARTLSGIPVNITNSAYIESMNQSYRIADGYDTISVTVEGYRSVVERLTSSSVTVTADLTQIIDMDSDPVMVPVSVSVPGISGEDITASPSNIRIILEDMESADFIINAVTGNTTPASGYQVGQMNVNPEQITIRGPASVIDRIGRVDAVVDVTGMSENTTLTPTLHIYDKNGDELSDTSMSYLSYNIDASDIRVGVVFYQVVSDIALEVETYGEPADGYYVSDVTVTPSTVSLVGSTSAIEALKKAGNKIVIDASTQAVNVTDAAEDLSQTLTLSDYLPDELSVPSDQSDTIVVNVRILQKNTGSFDIQTKDIEKLNLAADYTAVFTSTSLEVRVQGTEEALETLTASEIKASIDFSGYTAEGTQEVPVTITLPTGYTLAEEVMAEVTITRTVTTGETASSTAQPATAS